MSDLLLATQALAAEKIIAYPTESTWGLGVDATSKVAVAALNHLKKRPSTKSFIVLIENLHSIHDWVDWHKLPTNIDLNQNWPGPITKLVPTSTKCPPWLVYNGLIALRISAHPATKALCHAWQKPLISTSANVSGQDVLSTAEAIKSCFGEQISHYLDGTPGGLAPTRIINIMTQEILR